MNIETFYRYRVEFHVKTRDWEKDAVSVEKIIKHAQSIANKKHMNKFYGSSGGLSSATYCGPYIVIEHGNKSEMKSAAGTIISFMRKFEGIQINGATHD